MAPFQLYDLPRDTPRGVWILLHRQLRLHFRLNLKAIEQVQMNALIFGLGSYRLEERDIREFLPKAPAETVILVIPVEYP